MKSVLWQRQSLSQYHNLAQLDEKWLKKGKNRGDSESETCINKMCFSISLIRYMVIMKFTKGRVLKSGDGNASRIAFNTKTVLAFFYFILDAHVSIKYTDDKQ